MALIFWYPFCCVQSQSFQNRQQMPAGDSGLPPPNFPRQHSMNGSQSPINGSIRAPSGAQTMGRPTSMSQRSRTSNGSSPRSPPQMHRSSSVGGSGGRKSVSRAGSIPSPALTRKRQLKYADAIWVKSEFDYEAQTDTNMTILAGQTLACFAHDPKEQVHSAARRFSVCFCCVLYRVLTHAFVVYFMECLRIFPRLLVSKHSTPLRFYTDFSLKINPYVFSVFGQAHRD